jgi:hypothetical protein
MTDTEIEARKATLWITDAELIRRFHSRAVKSNPN